jgi:limonene-1,2-epoxide hydrolase
MSQNADVLRKFFAALDRLDFGALAACCTDDCVYEDVPFAEATVTGPEAIQAKLEMAMGMLDHVVNTIHELLDGGDTAMVERTEAWHHATGEKATLQVAAVFKFREGKITLWRDYWDFPTLIRQQPASWLPDIPRPPQS